MRNVLSCLIVCLCVSPIHAQYAGGRGEPNDPYLIQTAEQMKALGDEPNDWGKHFKLTADIDLRGRPPTSGSSMSCRRWMSPSMPCARARGPRAGRREAGRNP